MKNINVKENFGGTTGKLKITIRDAESGEIKRIYNYDNVICTVGKTLIANNLTDATPDNAPRINYVALGSNAAVPSSADTQLGTETYRNSVASETNALNVAYVTGFFTATETSGTYLEAGLFSNGTGAANSGILVSHVAVSVTKAITETLTIDWTITIN